MTKPSGGYLKLWDYSQNLKVRTLDDLCFRAWVNALVAAYKWRQNGVLPPVEWLVLWFGMDAFRWDAALIMLAERGLIDRQPGGSGGVRYVVHDWGEWQENTTPSADRMRRKRERDRGRNGDVTAVTSDTPSSASSSTSSSTSTSKERAGARKTASPVSTSSQSTPQKQGLRPIDDDEPEPAAPLQAQSADPLFAEVYRRYQEFGDARSPIDRARAAWDAIDAGEWITVLEGLVVWALIEGKAKRAEPDRKVKYLDTWLRDRLWSQYRPSAHPEFAQVAKRLSQKWLDDAFRQVEAG